MIAPSEDRRIAGSLARGHDIPPTIQNAPQLQLGSELWNVAFWELCSERQVGFGLGPIPRSAIVDWAQAWELTEEQADDCVFYVRRMDVEYQKLKAPKDEE